MIVQEEWVSITTTPDVVERYLTDPALMAQWRSPLVQLDPLEGDLMTLGSVHKMRLKSLGMAGAEYTVAERDHEHILLTISGLWEGRELWRWFADGPRVVVQNRVEYEVPNESLRVFVVGIGRFVADLDMRVQLFRLRELIEGPPARRVDAGRGPQRIPVEE
ncbi:MAG TPA: SRPBCC family protein [Chloroflexaceae bacterium]|nr:SRPBCC family protein [Chloroflexaceae bacterium]